MKISQGLTRQEIKHKNKNKLLLSIGGGFCSSDAMALKYGKGIIDMNKMIDTIKDVHRDYVCMFKVGTFYHVYNKDAYIMSYIFDYKINRNR